MRNFSRVDDPRGSRLPRRNGFTIEVGCMNWKAFKGPFAELVRSRPGQRFQDFHNERRRNRTRPMTALRIAAGVFLVALGIVLSMPPLVPGFLVTAAGLAVIASQSRRVARWMDGFECWLRRLW